MEVVDIVEAKAKFSQIIEQVASGSSVVIAMAGKPVARLSPLEPAAPIRFGVLKGKVTIAADFDAPLPGTVLQRVP